jgi:hypothetical protein
MDDAATVINELRALAQMVEPTDECVICAELPCPYHLLDYNKAHGACYCHLYADWHQLDSYIDTGDLLRCAECDQRVLWGWVWVGPPNMTDADLRALGTFRRGDYFRANQKGGN